MKRTDLQNYIIKRQFIENIELIDNSSPKTSSERIRLKRFPRFRSSQVEDHFQTEFTLRLDTELISNRAFKSWYDDASHPQVFNSNVIVLAQHLIMQDVTTEQILSESFPECEEIKLTPEFLRWDFPAIKEIVIAYLNDTSIFKPSNKNFDVMVLKHIKFMRDKPKQEK